ncbi:hypothetical protein ACLSZP_10420 [Avibacterium avium]|uniref:hypothetical protein n=1 Tax=Avibacterium avium TaxID=751 RepID=UPI003BF7D835
MVALVATGFIIVTIIILAIRFWYLLFIAMLIMLFPVLYLEDWLVWVLVPIIAFLALMWLVPVPDEQKADYEKSKAEFKASWEALISKK